MFDKRLFQTPPRPSMVVASWKEPIPGVLMTITINCNNNIDTKSLLFGLSKYQSHMMGKDIHANTNTQQLSMWKWRTLWNINNQFVLLRLDREPEWPNWHLGGQWQGCDANYVGQVRSTSVSLKKYFNRTFPTWEIFQTWHGGRLHPGGHVHQPHGRRRLAHCRQPYQPHACEIYHIAYTCLNFLICQVLNSTSHCSISVKYVRQPCWRCTTAPVGQPTPSHGANFSLWASNHLSEFSQFFPLKSLAPFPGGFPLKASTGIHTPSTGRTTYPTELRRLAVFSTKICF